MVVDTSVILAIFFAEKHAAWCVEKLNSYRSQLMMSTVNLTEALILIRDRQLSLANQLEETLLTSGISFVPPSVAHAKIAAQARLDFPLNLGDCFAYALAKAHGVPLLTVDSDFRKTDLQLLFP